MEFSPLRVTDKRNYSAVMHFSRKHYCQTVYSPDDSNANDIVSHCLGLDKAPPQPKKTHRHVFSQAEWCYPQLVNISRCVNCCSAPW